MSSNMEERFSEATKWIMKRAQYDALNYPREDLRIGTEHLLISLFHAPQSLRFLSGWLGMSEWQISNHIALPKKSTTLGDDTRLELSDNLKWVIKIALKEVKIREHGHLHPSHLVFGLSQVPDCRAMTIVRDFGISIDEFRRQAKRLVSETRAWKYKDFPAQILHSNLVDELHSVRKVYPHWDLKCVVVETTDNKTVSDFKINFLDFWRLSDVIKDAAKKELKEPIGGDLFVYRLNEQHSLIVSLEETQP